MRVGVALLGLWLAAGSARAQEPAVPPDTASAPEAGTDAPAAAGGAGRVVRFLAGGAAGLFFHESGHVLCDLAFGVGVNAHRVDFHGIPFFALSAEERATPRQRYVITSAGFWVQHAGSEWILSRRPNLRHERAPFTKGVLAFNVLASVAYSGAAFAQTGPIERDTHGMADALRIPEPWVGAMVLTPALLDAWRYQHPEARWARWASRAVKVGLVLLVVRPYGD